MKPEPDDTSQLIVRHASPNPNATWRIVAVPHAGAGPNAVADWSRLACADSEVVFARLPGRESRFSETCLDDANDAGHLLAEAICQLSPLPTVLLGHSMGALIAYRAAAWLDGQGWPMLCGLIISGLPPPNSERLCPKVNGLDDTAFLEFLADFGGLPKELAGEHELLALFLPLLRADFSLVERYQHSPATPLSVSICAISGVTDEFAPPDLAEGWSEFTSREFCSAQHPGCHFSITGTNGSPWRDAVTKALDALPTASSLYSTNPQRLAEISTQGP